MLTMLRIVAALVVAEVAGMLGRPAQDVTPRVHPALEVKRPSARRGRPCQCDKCRVQRMIASCPVTAHVAPEGWQ